MSCENCQGGFVMVDGVAKRCDCSKRPLDVAPELAIQAIGSAYCTCGKGKEKGRAFCSACERSLPSTFTKGLAAGMAKFMLAWAICESKLREARRGEVPDVKSVAAGDVQ